MERKTKLTGRGCHTCQPAPSVQSHPTFSRQLRALLPRERLCGAGLPRREKGERIARRALSQPYHVSFCPPRLLRRCFRLVCVSFLRRLPQLRQTGKARHVHRPLLPVVWRSVEIPEFSHCGKYANAFLAQLTAGLLSLEFVFPAANKPSVAGVCGNRQQGVAGKLKAGQVFGG